MQRKDGDDAQRLLDALQPLWLGGNSTARKGGKRKRGGSQPRSSKVRHMQLVDLCTAAAAACRAARCMGCMFLFNSLWIRKHSWGMLCLLLHSPALVEPCTPQTLHNAVDLVCLFCCRAPGPSAKAWLAPPTALRHQQQTAGQLAALLMVRREMRQRRHPGHSAGEQQGAAEVWLQSQHLARQCRLHCTAMHCTSAGSQYECQLLSQRRSDSTSCSTVKSL
jgi:hypothetical protein